jgi:copper chaperone NosL
MGAQETVPFSIRDAATKFALKNGGRVVTFGEVPRGYVLGNSESDTKTRDVPVATDVKGQDNG